MANTYSKAYFHLVFSVKFRESLISKSWSDKLEKYITGIISKQNHKLLAIGTMPDHIHIFIGYNLNQKIPELVEHIKTSSTRWINDNKFCSNYFRWQNGYGAFTHSRSQVEKVCKYVRNQEKHHKIKTFREEYIEMLKAFDVEFKNEYLFNFFDDQ